MKPRMRKIQNEWYCVGDGIVAHRANAALAYVLWERAKKERDAKAWVEPRIGNP